MKWVSVREPHVCGVMFLIRGQYRYPLCHLGSFEFYVIQIGFWNCSDNVVFFCFIIANKGNNKITELRAILQRESQNS